MTRVMDKAFALVWCRARVKNQNGANSADWTDLKTMKQRLAILPESSAECQACIAGFWRVYVLGTLIEVLYNMPGETWSERQGSGVRSPNMVTQKVGHEKSLCEARGREAASSNPRRWQSRSPEERGMRGMRRMLELYKKQAC